MDAKELLILNFQEIRRRSIRLWNGLPPECLHWRPSPDAMSLIETVRHVLESESIYHHIVLNRGQLGHFVSPLANNPLGSVDEELRYAQPYREKFLQMVNSFTAEELDTVYISRPAQQLHCRLGDYLLRIAYHESVQYGQLLGFLLAMETSEPYLMD
jgi:hypothetical protein